MSLALVHVPLSDFQFVYDHMQTYRTPSGRLHQNMHLRKMRQEANEPQLRYLHAMFASPANEIEGAISGRGLFWRYKIKSANGRTQLQVLRRRCSRLSEDARLQRRFLPEILQRVREEQAGIEHPPPRLKAGEFYLRRSMPGMHSGHENCVTAVETGILDPDFVAELHGWNLMLLNP